MTLVDVEFGQLGYRDVLALLFRLCVCVCVCVCVQHPAQTISLYGDVTIDVGMQNFSLCLEPKYLKLGGIFIVPHLL